MDQSLLTTAEIFAKPYLHISSAHWSWVASAFSLATAWGTLFAIPVGEFLGRKRALQISAALCFTGGIMQTAANTFPVLLAGRLLLGLGMGLEAMNIPIYLAECAPAYGRGGHLNFFNWFQQSGAPTAYKRNFLASEDHVEMEIYDGSSVCSSIYSIYGTVTSTRKSSMVYNER
ncbi:MFS transporter, SP family, sugar:H+ symporter [Galdieria sulphuraria]|uniref:MFS transporter, SP family, sugar:H+ symporter n=1 Tax=Galdieria sulphuraria TaxID=130081 RepID=M2XE89_GALSU|nr:MFS transporter, SP family, sugar:H+ symporter [Galdieria sulphuraria]EME28297.1 MFS transporter, SP family, sugar:H+ symporter [Galdieria sulphuraria]|eukprot:XP_005704817.1 MFS transporter, SP family, sugar:H+ symporter [Galdieria sulphuraria]